jgi:hypothetical protein
MLLAVHNQTHLPPAVMIIVVIAMISIAIVAFMKRRP